MANGVFSLLEVRTEQVKNIANENFASWPEGATYGYFGGNSAPGSGSNRLERIDLYNGTIQNSAKASTDRFPNGVETLAAVSSISYGYFAGGENPGGGPAKISRIYRFDFSNENMSQPGKNLPGERTRLAGIESNSYGYFGGGQDPGTPGFLNTITRLDFTTETVSNPGNNLPTLIRNSDAVRSNSYGYFIGGQTPPTTSINTINRIDFSIETISQPGKNLLDNTSVIAGTENDFYGYFSGVTNSLLERLEFSNETLSKPGSVFLNPSFINSGAVSGNFCGYFAGGQSPFPGVPSNLSTLTKLDFSNEIISDPGQRLTDPSNKARAISGGQAKLRGTGFKTYGYFGGGRTPGGPLETPVTQSDVYRLNFSTEVVDLPVQDAKLITESEQFAAFSNNSYGYFGGGVDDSSINLSTITRLDFFSEVCSNPGKYLPTTKTNLAALASNSYGYFAGGNNPSDSYMVRLDFSTETTSEPGQRLAQNRRQLATTSTNFYGYFGGGTITSAISTITRIDFSNETVSDLANFLPNIRELAAGASSGIYGYFAGGDTGPVPTPTTVNTITRFDFSIESCSNPGKNLPALTREQAATSSNSYGYFAGGNENGGRSSRILRLDFSTENVNVPSNLLPIATIDFAAVSNSN